MTYLGVILVGLFCFVWGRQYERQRMQRDLAPILDALDPMAPKPTPDEYGDLLSRAWRVLRGDAR